MADCEFLNDCSLFNDKMADCELLQGMCSMYKKQYCQSDNSKCARYMVAKKLGKEQIPKDLYPQMIDKAKEIIAEGQ